MVDEELNRLRGLRGGDGGEELYGLELDGLVERQGDEEFGIHVGLEEGDALGSGGRPDDGRQRVGGGLVQAGQAFGGDVREEGDDAVGRAGGGRARAVRGGARSRAGGGAWSGIWRGGGSGMTPEKGF